MHRWRYAVLVPLVMLIAGVVPATRDVCLRAAGRALVADDPVERVDVIVVAVDADGAGVLEAADLVRQGIAPRVAVFEDPPNATDRELLRRGVQYHDEAAESARQLKALGVNSVEVIPRAVAGTSDEGAILPSWCSAKGYRTAILVSTTDHSRRTRRIIHRAVQASGLKILVRASPYSDFDYNAWWHSRGGIRTELIESEKLLFDVLGHPLS